MSITKWKKSIWKGYLLYDSNFGKGETLGTAKRSVVARAGGRGEMSSQSQESFWAVKLLSVWYYNDGYMSLNIWPDSRSIQHQVNFNVNCGLCVIWCVIVGSSFITITNPVGVVDSGWGCVFSAGRR